MSTQALRRRLCTALIPWTALLIASSAAGDWFVINNGLAPPNPANVIDSGVPFPYSGLSVQNVGCDINVEPVCSSPGAPTTVLVAGYLDWAAVRETSTLLYEGSGSNANGYYAGITTGEIEFARSAGFVFKLIASAELIGDRPAVTVFPSRVSPSKS